MRTDFFTNGRSDLDIRIALLLAVPAMKSNAAAARIHTNGTTGLDYNAKRPIMRRLAMGVCLVALALSDSLLAQRPVLSGTAMPRSRRRNTLRAVKSTVSGCGSACT
jgi:hypothetical protein